jgi:hypothetical protein
MSKLKPIGSEKLQGSAKLNRMLEIAMYKEVDRQNINETSSKEYDINLPDGNKYFIIKEKVGYIIKRGLTESTLDYIEPMKNRTYYRSYSQALKKLNLITKELNEIYDNPDGISLFGEQKKYTLKTPKPPVDDMGDVPMPPPAPPAVPQPELPPSPLDGGGDMGDMGMPPPEGGEMPPMDDMGGEMPDMGDDEMGDDMPDMGDDEMGDKSKKGEEQITFKTIQKLTGRLTQKIRALENEEGLTSEEIKYVINMVISSLNIEALDEEDLDDIMSKFEGGEDMGDEDMGEMPDMGDEDMGEMPDMGDEDMGEMPDMGDEDMGEMPYMGQMPPPANGGNRASMGQMPPPPGGDESYAPKKRYSESKVDNILSRYFELTPQEKILAEQRKNKNAKFLKENLKSINVLSETRNQYLAAESFLNKYKRFKVMGKSNLGNIILKLNERTVKINKKGDII